MGPLTTRSRKQPTFQETGHKRFWYGGVVLDDAKFVVEGGTFQVTSSQGNPVSRIGQGEDIGGEFGTQLVRVVPGGTLVSVRAGNPLGILYTYDGPICAQSYTMSYTSAQFMPPSTRSDLLSYGTLAIARSLPTNPLAGMGQFLGELRDLPRVPDIKSWQTRIRNWQNETKRVNFDKLSRNAADEVLNGLFGWSPFISDLMKFAHTVRTSSVAMANYAKGSNHLIRRTYTFPTESTTVVENLGTSPGEPSLPDPLVEAQGTLTKSTVTSYKRYFKGAFTYYLPPIIPEDNEFVQAINKFKIAEAYANRLFGLRLTPDLLYKLTPWSWALDYVSTAGSVVHNWSAFAFDGLVLKYGYLMETVSNEEAWNLSGLRLTGSKPINTTQTRSSITKSRVRASPYGFGVNPVSFNAKQWAVIAALGISRQPLSLNF